MIWPPTICLFDHVTNLHKRVKDRVRKEALESTQVFIYSLLVPNNNVRKVEGLCLYPDLCTPVLRVYNNMCRK